MRKILLLGSVGSGKTTLMQRLRGAEMKYHKTQSISDDGFVIDTPGEYLDMGVFKFALQLHAHEAQEVIIIHSATSEALRIPPGFVSYFTKPVTGIINKIDIADQEGISRARQFLELAGISRIFEISAITGEGMDELIAHLSGTEPVPATKPDPVDAE